MNNPEIFKKELQSALNNPQEKQAIMDYVKVLTPQFSDEQRDQMFGLMMKAINNPSSVSSTSSPGGKKDYINKEVNASLSIAKLPIDEIIYHRSRYYLDIGISPPENYEPRMDVSKWDLIDLYETSFYISKDINIDVHKEQLNKYITYLEGKLVK